MLKSLTIIPAYGRDYKNQQQVKEAFHNGKDFLIQDISCPWNGKYCSVRDLQKDYDSICIRYSQLRKLIIIKL